MKGKKPCVALVAALLASFVNGAQISVGRIVVDKYEPLDDNGLKGAGATFTVHYEFNGEVGKQDCFKKENVRWLQWLSVSDKSPPLTPIPNRPFIDPRKDQPTPGTPTGKGDDLPFYDFSYPTLKDSQDNTNILVNGSGPYLRDDPRSARGQEGIMFEFRTMMVAIMPDNFLMALGGFDWGFKVNAQGKSELMPVSGISGETICLGRFPAMNNAMKNDFPTWGGVGNGRSFCPDSQYYLNVVPEPATWVAGAIGLALFGSRRVNRNSATCSS